MSFEQKYSKHVRVVLLSVKPIFLLATMLVANQKQFEMQKIRRKQAGTVSTFLKRKVGLSLNCTKLTLQHLDKDGVNG